MTRAALDRARHLLRARERRAQGRFLAEGPHLLEEALLAGVPLEDVFVAHEALEREELARLVDRAEADGARVFPVRARELARIADTQTPQGLVAVAPLPTPRDAVLRGGWVVLDGVQDPGNVGTLLRAADAFGLSGVVTGEGTADPWSGKVVRAGQGAHFRLDVRARGYGDVDAAAFLDTLTATGGEVWAADLSGDAVYDTAPPAGPFALLLGSEAHGLSDELAGRATRSVRVPQPGRADSLNVAMAGTVLLSWMTRTGTEEELTGP